jgi:hypothetical protein
MGGGMNQDPSTSGPEASGPANFDFSSKLRRSSLQSSINSAQFKFTTKFTNPVEGAHPPDPSSSPASTSTTDRARWLNIQPTVSADRDRFFAKFQPPPTVSTNTQGVSIRNTFIKFVPNVWNPRTIPEGSSVVDHGARPDIQKPPPQTPNGKRWSVSSSDLLMVTPTSF